MSTYLETRWQTSTRVMGSSSLRPRKTQIIPSRSSTWSSYSTSRSKSTRQARISELKRLEPKSLLAISLSMLMSVCWGRSFLSSESCFHQRSNATLKQGVQGDMALSLSITSIAPTEHERQWMDSTCKEIVLTSIMPTKGTTKKRNTVACLNACLLFVRLSEHSKIRLSSLKCFKARWMQAIMLHLRIKKSKK